MVSDDRPPTRPLRLGGWGFEGERFPPSPELLAWLRQRLGETAPFPSFDATRLAVPEPRRLPELPGELSREPLDRLAHARGQGLTDLLRLRSGTVPAAPDAVVRPRSASEVEGVLRAAAGAGVRIVPWGGGTSVTGGVTVQPGPQPVLTLDLEHLSGLADLDATSGLAVFGAGTRGPALEAALAPRGLTLGHFPQSWELSTLGGWIVTRASGQESLGYGSIEALVAGLEVVAPAGRLELPPLPASAAGPDLRQLVLGSEGRLGVVTRAAVRVRPRPAHQRVEAHLLPSWEAGLTAARAIVQASLPLSLLRLSDEPETEVAVAAGLSGRAWLAPLVAGWLRLRGFSRRGCLLLLGAGGEEPAVWDTLRRAASLLRPHRAVGLGAGPGRHWLADRFRHPYLRDALLDLGIATDTLETAAPWSRLTVLTEAVRRALAGALEEEGERVAVLCHVSHPYPDGASLYFTFFFRCPPDADAACHRWATLKRTATEALVTAGGTLSHHHGVGTFHAPWLEREIGGDGRRLLAAAAATLDPAATLNPAVLLDPADRLEV